MASCNKNFSSEEIIHMIIGEENETKKVTRSRERKQTELLPSLTKKSKLQSFYGKGISKFTSLQEALSTIDEEDESVRNVTLLPPESGERGIPTDGEDNFEDNASFPTEVAGELEDHYNLISKAEGEKTRDGPTSSNRDRKRTATRNTTKNTTNSLRTRMKAVNATQMMTTMWLSCQKDNQK